jgi:hypothetical protein
VSDDAEDDDIEAEDNAGADTDAEVMLWLGRPPPLKRESPRAPQATP